MSAILDRKLHQAATALAAGDLARAELLSREVLQRAPSHPRALQLVAAARLQQDDAAGAGDLLLRALEHDPRNPEVLQGLGFAALKAERFNEAEQWLGRAIESRAGGPNVHCWLGLALSAQGRHAEAVAAFRRALTHAPRDAGLLLNLGNELMQAGSHQEAIAAYEQAVAHYPDYAEAFNSLGSALTLEGRYEEAATALRRAVSLREDYPEAHDNLGNALLNLEQDADAEISFRRAIALQPANPDYHLDLGNALSKQRRWNDAIAEYEHSLGLRPESGDTAKCLAAALLETDRPEQALVFAQQGVSLSPDWAAAHETLGNILLRLGRKDEANACYRKAIELEPQNSDHYFMLGNALVAQMRLTEGLEQLDRAQELAGGASADVKLMQAITRLFLHEFEPGWDGYECRFDTKGYRKYFRDGGASDAEFRELRRWPGPSEPAGGRVSIWAEQGIGDQVLYSTLIPELVATGVDFLYEVDKRLIEAYRRSFPEVFFVPKQDPPHEDLVRTSSAAPSGSLPGMFRRSVASFGRQPARLLAALPERAAHYRQKLDEFGRGPKVAFSWRSNRKNWRVAGKNARLEDFSSFLNLQGLQVVDVQYGNTGDERRRAEEAIGARLLRFQEVDHLNELEEVIAILQACDLVVTTSNATAHFAGALGKRTWLMYLADCPQFYYWSHRGTYRSLWYPSVEIVTAEQLTSWEALASHVRDKAVRELM